MASQILSVPKHVDLGPAPNGGRHYLNLSEGLDVSLDSNELQGALEDAVRGFFKERRRVIRASLAEWIREARRATQEEDSYELSFTPRIPFGL
jgi:hypothetical protein